LAAGRREELQNHLLLFFTGFSRFASEIESSKLVNFSQKAVALQRMMDMVTQAEDLLLDGSRDLHQFGWMLQEAWEYKKSLSSNVSTSAIDAIYNRAIAAGALGGKILGAGGGGFILFFVPPTGQSAVRNALQELIEVPFGFEQEGSRVVMG
jgi:D-glycero-alpha-D-manno-heptose-7-phosphate kinase